MYVTVRDTLDPFMDVVQRAHSKWKAFAVNPMRLADALTAIRPRLVILDSELNDVARLAEQARLRSCQGTVVASDGDRATVTRLLDSM